MATIKDLAKYCNVSISTVSYALNDSDEISNETKEKIKKAAKELNYVPNAYARGLKRKRTYNIGVVISGFEGPIHHNVLAGIANELKAQNSQYNMLVTLSDEKMFLVKEKSVDLAIIMDSKANNDIIIELSKIVPIITFDHYITGDNIYNTTIDNMQGIYLETMNLISKGCKRIAYLLGSKHSCHNKKRFEGYVKALEENNIKFDGSIVFDADAFTELRGFDVINDFAYNNQTLPFDSLICANDELAIGAIKALKANGIRVPEDVKVAGFDNIAIGSYMSPSLSTVSVDWMEYGATIARLALDILNHKESGPVEVPVQIIERESSKIS
jgi:LacI family transcriptional regulator